MILFAIAIYLVGQFAIGYYISRRISSEKDYLIGGRKLGIWLATFSIFATWFGAETCIGAAGRVYNEGLSGATHDPFGYAFCILLAGLFIAKPLWKLKLTTLGDLFKIKYGGLVERTASIIMIPTSLLWAAAQMRAFGQILSTITQFELELMVLISALIIILYTYLGGLLADAWTDLIQGAILAIGLITLLLFFIYEIDFQTIGLIPDHRLSFTSAEEFSFFSLLESWMVPVIGSLVAAELLTRMIASKSPEIAQKASTYAFIIYLTIGIIPLIIGLIGPQIIPDLPDGEKILPLISQAYLPTFLHIIFLGALLSAILSTVDSALLTCGSLTSHNLILPLRRKQNETEKYKLKLARLSVIFFGIVGLVLALSADGVYHLVAEASSLGSAGLVTVVLFSLYGNFGGKWSAMASLLSGLFSYIFAAYIFEYDYPFILSLAFSIFSYILFSVLLKGSINARSMS